MDRWDSLSVDRSAFVVSSLTDEPEEKAYWLSRSPYERLRAIEWMRQIVYGYDPVTVRLQRVLEVTELISG
jgi:hypothetical protein